MRGGAFKQMHKGLRTLKGYGGRVMRDIQRQLQAVSKPLTERGKGSNRTKSVVRARGEHVLGAQINDTGGTLVQTICLVHAEAKIGMKNLAYNMKWLAQLRRLNLSYSPMFGQVSA